VFVRSLVGAYTGAQIPFITFYPAVIVAALIGGLGPGILAAVLSSVAAWYFFIPSHLAWPGQREIAELLLFAFISGMDVAIAVVLTWLIERLILQQRNIRILLESAPTGRVTVLQSTLLPENAGSRRVRLRVHWGLEIEALGFPADPVQVLWLYLEG
jgi:hypothetical protein